MKKNAPATGDVDLTKTMKKRAEEEFKATSFRVPVSLMDKLKLYSLYEKKPMSKLLCEWIESLNLEEARTRAENNQQRRNSI
ncbi:hypothetical protein [Bifidobacterium mongoliense]|jgi:hypothetical protein|uniref:Uncharacterized protein n=1 Tax=Bifidobacterium mongoliense TaxID=518643 RepID=A0A423UBV9_9BIFI|nr:hypothetical protein [Bifidobacterium mongoliense]ROT86180.1 hypothetical protein BMONG18_1688 [Bifidobacterium mongoliense]